MPKAHSRLTRALVALALALLAGRVTDATTGQPLAGVQVTAARGIARHAATTGRDGRFALKLAPGTYRLTWQSRDVPPHGIQTVRVHGTTTYDIKACSTTLDYNCGGGSGSGANG